MGEVLLLAGPCFAHPFPFFCTKATVYKQRKWIQGASFFIHVHSIVRKLQGPRAKDGFSDLQVGIVAVVSSLLQSRTVWSSLADAKRQGFDGLHATPFTLPR